MHSGTAGKTELEYFQQCLCDCARSPWVVAGFNQAHGTHLVAPLRELLPLDEGGRPPQEDSEVVAWAVEFIHYVHSTVWKQVEVSTQRLQTRTVVLQEAAVAPADSDRAAEQ